MTIVIMAPQQDLILPFSFLIIILIVILPAIRGLRLGVRLRAEENELHFNLNDTGIG